MADRDLTIFGFGYTAAALARRLIPAGWTVTGTYRKPDAADAMRALGVTPIRADRLETARITRLLATAAPGEAGDPLLQAYGPALLKAPLQWLGYLSTTGVYGDAGGGWVDEAAPIQPAHERGARRARAEIAFAELGEETGAAACIFRLPGIYGPGRSALDQLRNGTAKRLVKPGQLFSRIHVDDIAAALEAALALETGTVLNLADDEPAPPQDVVTFAADLLGIPPPPEEDFEAARPHLSAMALEFYGASRRIANGRMKQELGLSLLYPTYREGLRAIVAGADGT